MMPAPMDMIFGLFFSTFFLALLAGSFLFYMLLIYFLAPQPNRLVSAVMNYKILGAGLIFTLVGAGSLVSKILAFLGFRSDATYTWDLVEVRHNIIHILLGLFLWYIGKTYFSKNIYNPEVAEGKEALTYSSHVLHAVFGMAVIVLKTYLLYLILNYLLSFILPGSFPMTAKDFVTDLLSGVAPLLLLGLLFKGSIMGTKRFLPAGASVPTGIFQILVFAGFLAVTAVGVSVLVHDLTLLVFSWSNMLETYEVAPSMDSLRQTVVLLAIGAIGTWMVWTRAHMVWKTVNNGTAAKAAKAKKEEA